MKIFLYWSLSKKPGYTTIFKIIAQSFIPTFLVKFSIYHLQCLLRNALVSLEQISTEFCYFNIQMQKWVTPSKSSSKCQSIKEMARWRGERQERSLLVIPHPVPAPALLPVSVGWRLCARQLVSFCSSLSAPSPLRRHRRSRRARNQVSFTLTTVSEPSLFGAIEYNTKIKFQVRKFFTVNFIFKCNSLRKRFFSDINKTMYKWWNHLVTRKWQNN